MVRHGEHGTKLLPAAIAAFCAIVALTTAGAFFPSALTWGFHALAFLPRTYLAGYLLAAAVLLLVGLRGRAEEFITPVAAFMGRRPHVFLGLCAGGFALFAALMRVSAPLLGDSFYLVRNYSEAAHGVAPLYYRNEPLATLLFSFLLKLFGMATFADFLSAFLGAEILLGVVTIVSLFWTIRLLVRSDEDRFLAFVFVIAFPVMQLYFGYIEIYAAVVCAVSVYLLTVTLHLTGRRRFRYRPLVLLGVSLTHYATVLLAPALAYLAWRDIRTNGPREVALGVGLVAGAVMTLLVIVGFDVSQYSSWVPHSHLLPLAPPADEAERYTTAFTLFSPYHLVDVGNLILLVSPAALLLIAFAVATNFRALLGSALHRFFLASILPAIGFLFVVKYDLGGARDWDVFTFVYFTLALYAAILYATSEAGGRRRTTFLLAGLTALNSFLFFSVNHRDDASEARFRSLFDRRLLSQAGFYSGSLYLAQYYHQVRDLSAPVTVWKRYIAEFPADERGYKNVLVNSLRNDPLPDAETVALFERWCAIAADSSSAPVMYAGWCAEAGARYASAGDAQRAERLYRRGTELTPDSPASLGAYGAFLVRRSRIDEALPLLERAAAIDSTIPEPAWLLARIRLDRGQNDQGYRHLARAARLGYPGAATLLERLRRAPTTNRISITEKN